MPRQPFRRVYKDAAWAFGPRAVGTRPTLAALVADCIGCWSAVELNMALMMSSLLQANSEPAIALFSTLKNARSQREVLLAVANVVLSGDRLRAFEAALNIHKSLESQRNDLAHGMLGYSGKIPDIILWISAADLANCYAVEYAMQANHAAIIEAGLPIPKRPDPAEKIFFYREADLRSLLDDMDAFYLISSKLMHHLSRTMDHPLDAEELREICALPLMERELSRMREGPRKNP